MAEAVAIVIPMLNEEGELPRLARTLSVLDPAPAEILLVDGGSTDRSVETARDLGFTVRTLDGTGKQAGRAAQINLGVESVDSPLVCVLHADTAPPHDTVQVIRRVLNDGTVSLAGFTAILSGHETVRWGTSFHNWLKTWYAPLLFRPVLFLNGGRLLFGDHAMFFRRSDFLAVGGCDETLPLMEDADLCIRLTARGRVRLVNRIVLTSDRRIAAWGGVRANLIYLWVGIRWGLGLRKGLDRHYPDVR